MWGGGLCYGGVNVQVTVSLGLSRRFFLRKPELKTPFPRLRLSWVDSIKTDLRGIRPWGRGLDWSGRRQGQGMGSCVRISEPPGCMQCGAFRDWLMNCRRPTKDPAAWSWFRAVSVLCVLQAKCLIPALYTVPWSCVHCLAVSQVWKFPDLIVLFVLCPGNTVYLIWPGRNINRTNASEVQIFDCPQPLDMKYKWRDWTADSELRIRFKSSRRRTVRIPSAGIGRAAAFMGKYRCVIAEGLSS
jgi:hypothetical protein